MSPQQSPRVRPRPSADLRSGHRARASGATPGAAATTPSHGYEHRGCPRRRLLLSGDCESGGRGGEWARESQSAHAVPYAGLGRGGSRGADAPRPRRLSALAGSSSKHLIGPACLLAPTGERLAARRSSSVPPVAASETGQLTRGTGREPSLLPLTRSRAGSPPLRLARGCEPRACAGSPRRGG
jgi:hypothetical protein